MKKLYSIALVLFYLTLSVGVVKNTHYCMGRVLDVEYFSTSGDSCLPGMEDMQCCSSELELVKIADDQSQALFNLNTKQLFEIQTLSPSFEYSLIINDHEEEKFTSNYDLPPPRVIPIYKLHCNYTYYG